MNQILFEYEARVRELQATFLQMRYHSGLLAVALTISAALFVAASVYALRQHISFVWPSIAISTTALLAYRFRLVRESQHRTWRLMRYYERAAERLKGNWPDNEANGAEFCDADHAYGRELNVVGDGSLFQLLCTARTANGRRGLAQYLLDPPTVNETVARQNAIRELGRRSDLRERVALLGEFDFADSTAEAFTEWLDSSAGPMNNLLRLTAFASSAVLAGLILVGFVTNLVPWNILALWIAPIVAFHAVVGLTFKSRVNQILEFIQPVSVEVQVLQQGLQLIETQKFESAKLRDLTDRVRGSSKSVRRLERLLNAVHQRTQPWFYGPSLLLLFATQTCMSIEAWRIKNGADLRVWLDAWAEFEALNSLATYAHENPENTFPEFSGNLKFEAEGLGHPLLRRESCVTNDLELNAATRFYVLSGSNMSGKSTLLRAIGLNAVLAFAGAPVRAGSLRLSPVRIWASISVVDSLMNGKSKFLAEVDRLRRTLEAAESERVLFLVDEIFGGTNSRDRRIAAGAVIRTLVDRGAMGALSTHDVALCEIAAENIGGSNVHMGSRSDDPVDFDYRLKRGVTTESSAIAIARMAGVPI